MYFEESGFGEFERRFGLINEGGVWNRCGQSVLDRRIKIRLG